MVVVNAHILTDVMLAWMSFFLTLSFLFLSHSSHQNAQKHTYTWRQSRKYSIYYFFAALECAYMCIHFVMVIWGKG